MGKQILLHQKRRRDEGQMRKLKYLAGILVTVLLIWLDQMTKHLAVTHLKGKSSFVILEGVFELTYVENRGAAFGIFQNQRWMFLVLTLVIIAGVFYVVLHLPQEKRFLPVEILSVLILSGAVGNMTDRIVHGYVIDFFYFSLINFPVFNVADCYVTISCVVLLVLAFYYKEEDLDLIWPFGKK